MTTPKRLRLRSRISGRNRTRHLYRPEDLPWVLEALHWLLGSHHRASIKPVKIASARGLIRSRSTGFTWAVDEKIFRRLLHQRLSHNPSTPKALAIYGLGELWAHAISGEVSPLPTMARLKRRQRDDLLKDITAVAREEIPPFTALNVGVRDAMKAQRLTKEVRQHARNCMEHPPHPEPWLFGLSVLLESMAIYHPRALGDWLGGKLPTAIDLTALKYLGERALFATPIGKIHLGLIRTKRPLLQAIAAHALAHGGFHKRRVTFLEFLTLGVEANLSPGQSFSLAMAAVEYACLNQSQAASKVAQTEQRLRLLREKPDQAMGGAKQAPVETERLHVDLLKWQQLADDAIVAQDTLITDIANAWTNDLDAEHLANLRDAFGRDRDFLSVQLARAIKNKGHTNWMELVEPIITTSSDFLGLLKPSESFKQPFLDQPDTFRSIVKAFPAAIILRYEQDKRGVEHRASLLFAQLIQAADRWMELPYAAQRWPREYESALGRCAATVLLAFCVAEFHTKAGMKTSRLVELALQNSIHLFERDRSDIVSHLWVDRLALLCVRLMANGQINDHRSEWSTNANFPAFIRAIAIWSDHSLRNQDLDKALSLFQTALSPTQSASTDRMWFRTFHLLDVAFHTIGGVADAPSVEGLISMWPTVYSYMAHLDKHDAISAPELLKDAMSGDSAARDAVLHSSRWHQSLCAELIRSTSNTTT